MSEKTRQSVAFSVVVARLWLNYRIGRATVTRMIEEGTWPAPQRLNARCQVYDAETIEKAFAKLDAARSAEAVAS
jgi:predicted DNA-binding transcriptional regulator AlpA